MYLSKWNIGLEIHSGGFNAVALQQKRYGWQLRGWWQISLNQPVLNQQGLLNPELLTEKLSQWRKQLPKIISLRIVFPCRLVLQQPLKLPPQPLSPQELGWYLDASVSKLFPLSAHELIIDYRAQTVASQQQLLITATRSKELLLWTDLLKRAGFRPEAIDITPCILRTIARAAAISADNLLMHRQENQWLIVSPLADDFYFELMNESGLSLADYKALACQRYNSVTNGKVSKISVSGDLESFENGSEKEIHFWTPFNAIQRLQPPLPKLQTLFTVPCGLAMREPDHDTSQSASVA